MKNTEILWLLDTLSSQSHPDPEGFVASLDLKSNNPANINEEEAAKYGVTKVDEPALSIYSAMARDKDVGVGDKYRDADRVRVREMASQALAENKSPTNPFIDESGMWKLGFKPASSSVVDEKALRKTIRELL